MLNIGFKVDWEWKSMDMNAILCLIICYRLAKWLVRMRVRQKRKNVNIWWWSVSGGWKWIGLCLLVSLFKTYSSLQYTFTQSSILLSLLSFLLFFLRIPSHQLFLLASTCLPFHFSLNFSLHFSFILVERCTNVRTDVWESVCMYVSMMFVCVWMGRCRPIYLFGKYVRKWDEIVVWLKGKKASKWVSEKESCTQGHPSVKPVLSTSFLNPFLSS